MNIEYNAVVAYSYILFNNYDRLQVNERENVEEIIRDEMMHFGMLSEYLRVNSSIEFLDLPCSINIIKDIKKSKKLEELVFIVSLAHESKGLTAGPKLI